MRSERVKRQATVVSALAADVARYPCRPLSVGVSLPYPA